MRRLDNPVLCWDVIARITRCMGDISLSFPNSRTSAASLSQTGFREVIRQTKIVARDLRSSPKTPRMQTFRLLADDPAEKNLLPGQRAQSRVPQKRIGLVSLTRNSRTRPNDLEDQSKPLVLKPAIPLARVDKSVHDTETSAEHVNLRNPFSLKIRK